MREKYKVIEEIEPEDEEEIRGRTTKFYSIDNVTDGKVYYVAKTLKEAQAKLKMALQKEETKGKNVRIVRNISKKNYRYYYYCSPAINV